MSNWNFSDKNEMYNRLIGQNYGSDPAGQIEKLKADKKHIATAILKWLALKKSDVKLLEIGSGCGYISEHLAPHVKELHCADISESFLEEARKNCQHLTNVRFHLIQSAQLDFLADASMDGAVAYNVFIHFNLFDMYWYFAELKRIIRPGGFVFFDFATTKDLKRNIPPLFKEMAHLYKQNPETVNLLVQWHHPEAIVSIARHFGFEMQNYSKILLEESPLDDWIARVKKIVLKKNFSPYTNYVQFIKNET